MLQALHQSSPESDWQDAAGLIFERLADAPLSNIARLTGGIINRVFACTATNRERLVLRLAPWTQAQNRRGAAAWTEILHANGTGVVPYLATAPEGDPAPCFWMAMSFVEGLDLGKALPGMTPEQQQMLAHMLSNASTWPFTPSTRTRKATAVVRCVPRHATLHTKDWRGGNTSSTNFPGACAGCTGRSAENASMH